MNALGSRCTHFTRIGHVPCIRLSKLLAKKRKVPIDICFK
jgi:hypothetical protein